LSFRLSVFIALLFSTAIALAQPIPPGVKYPIPINKGGFGQSMALTTVSTSGTINNQALATGYLKFTNSSVSLTGLVSSGTEKIAMLYNASGAGNSLTLYSEHSSSTAANRFSFPGNATLYVPYNGAALLVYDTNSSRWRVVSITSLCSYPSTISYDGSCTLPVSNSGQAGYLSSSDYIRFDAGINWARSANDIYNTNTRAVQVGSRACASLVSYATCYAKTGYGCSLVNGNACSVYNGNQSACEGVAGSQCSWDSGMSQCNGSYFSSCSGTYHYDDGTSAILQVHDFQACTGSATACTSSPVNSDSTNCNNQSGCNWFSGYACSAFNYEYGMYACSAQSPCNVDQNSCGGASDSMSCYAQNSSYGGSCDWIDDNPSCVGFDEANCNSHAGCTPNAFDCSALPDESSCSGHTGCTPNYGNDCSTFNSDFASCSTTSGCTPNYSGDCTTASYPDCTSLPGCSDMGDHCEGLYFTSCSGMYYSGCSGSPFDNCSGTYSSYSCHNTYNNGNCSGTYGAGCTDNPGAYACSTFGSSTPCTNQNGCSYTTTPAISASGSITSTSLTGSQKIVCVKSDGTLGVCSGSYSSGTCTCS
jgi:hypothetical protein